MIVQSGSSAVVQTMPTTLIQHRNIIYSFASNACATRNVTPEHSEGTGKLKRRVRARISFSHQ